MNTPPQSKWFRDAPGCQQSGTMEYWNLKATLLKSIYYVSSLRGSFCSAVLEMRGCEFHSHQKPSSCIFGLSWVLKTLLLIDFFDKLSSRKDQFKISGLVTRAFSHY